MPDQLLPKVAIELAEIIGMDGALRLIEKRGGIKIKVPKKPDIDHWLRTALTVEELAKLVAHYDGEEIDLPILHAKRQAVKWADMERLRSQGETVTNVALHHQMTERGVYKVFKRTRDKQQSEMDI